MAGSEKGDQSKCHLNWSRLAGHRRGGMACLPRITALGRRQTPLPSLDKGGTKGRNGDIRSGWSAGRSENQQLTYGRVPAPPEAARVPSGNDFLGVPATPAFVAWVDSETSFHLFQALHPQKKWRANSALRHTARASHHGRGNDHSVFEIHPCQTITIASVSSSQYRNRASIARFRSNPLISVNCILA